MNNLINEANLNEAYEVGRNGNCKFNCWNATLFVLGKTNDLYWSDVDEIEKFLFGDTSVVANAEKGDILVLYGYVNSFLTGDDNNEDRILHTAIYTGNNKWFHKRGENQSEFVTEEEIADIYDNYERSEIRRVDLLTNSENVL